MSAIPVEMPRSDDPTVKISVLLDRLEELLGRADDGPPSARLKDDLKETLITLHSQIRRHHAVSLEAPPTAPDSTASPELTRDRARLADEHSTMLGMLDRILRCMDSVMEEQALCALRIRELIAVIRRHEAEEETVLFRSVWVEPGGESG